MKQREAGIFRYLLNGISVSPDAEESEMIRQASAAMKRMGFSSRALHFRLYKRSVDARKKGNVRLICTVLVESGQKLPDALCRRYGLRMLEEPEPEQACGTKPLGAPPMVIGMGPAGLFAALLLARNGYAPILIDRGGDVAERVSAVENFRKNGILDTECNVQFGAGGAGTFSDGKLVTRIHDPYCRFVLRTLHDAGAPDEILTLAKPHIGTDVLRGVVSRILAEIQAAGGKVIFRCRMNDFRELPDGTLSVSTSKGELLCGAMVLAIGHSARDTYHMLIGKQLAIEPKPLSVGVRAEHLQEDIDRALYGSYAGHPNLGHAEYALSDTKGERGVYTFCMCPGGEVVAAASETEGLAVNGMSNHSRNGKNANAAVLVSVGVNDYEPVNGNAALGAIAFQRSVESAAFRAGGSDYAAPVMTAGDFLNGRHGTEPGRIQPTYREGIVRVADFRSIFPEFISTSLQYALRSFGKKLPGYDQADAVLTAAETRTSAPLRILRVPEQYTAIGHNRIYPCGEGAGYAGGITSAAVDGIRVAEAMMKQYAPDPKHA